MCSRNCCLKQGFVQVINQPPCYVMNKLQKPSPFGCFPAAEQSGFGISTCLPTCCPHPGLGKKCVRMSSSFGHAPCPCPIETCRCAGECCPRPYCSPPFVPPFV